MFSPPCFRCRRVAEPRTAEHCFRAIIYTKPPLRSAGLSGCPVAVPSPRFVSFPRLLADLPRFTGPSSHPISRYPSMVLCQCSVILCLSGTRHEAGYVTRESGRRMGGTDGRASRTGGDVTRTDARRVGTVGRVGRTDDGRSVLYLPKSFTTEC